MELKIYIKQSNSFNSKGQPVVYIGSSPSTLSTIVNGTLPANRQWPQYGNYVDFTSYCSDLFKLKLTWTTEKDKFGNISTVAQQQKSSSGTLTIENEGFKLLKKWLYEDVSAPLNAVDIRVEHVGCGTYEDYQVRAIDCEFCEVDPNTCTIDITMKQKDENLKCIKNTLINDDWQEWFRNNTTKQHPRFSYCNEQRPNGILVVLWVLLMILFSIVTILIVPLIIAFNLVIIVILGIVTVINTIINAINTIPGINIPTIPTQNLQPISISSFFDDIANMFLETAGCGREHPAPLIRDYISNVCSKCNVFVDGGTAPLFFSPTWQIETISRGLLNEANPYYNSCYLYAPVRRGIRRDKNTMGMGGVTGAAQDHYIIDNAPNKTLDVFLDELKTLFNFEWKLSNNTLYIQRPDSYVVGSPLYDFTQGSPDRAKMLHGICTEWNTIKMPAAVKGIYNDDPADKPGNEAKRFMNGYWQFGDTLNNPNFDGLEDRTQNFGATRFRLDGVEEDYLYDAFQVTLNISTLLGPLGLAFIPTRNAIRDSLELFADYALLLDGETCSLPKILIWDRYRTKNARAIKKFAAMPIADYPMPAANTKYSSSPWYVVHEAKTDVKGQGLTIPPFYPGYYSVTGTFGAFEIKKPAILVNYPMYFEPRFESNLYDYLHWIIDPMTKPKANLSFTATIELCCDDLQKLGVFNSPNGVKLGGLVKINAPYNSDGKITEIEVDYDHSKEIGQSITIKGIV